jgi:hypothetical protein
VLRIDPTATKVDVQINEIHGYSDKEVNMHPDPQTSLAQTHLFTRATYDFTLPKVQRQEVTHARASAIAMSFSTWDSMNLYPIAQRFDFVDLTVEDVLTCSEKFWDSTLHPINTIDGAATALWTIHVNLACGTLAQYASSRPEIRDLCHQILAFEIS